MKILASHLTKTLGLASLAAGAAALPLALSAADATAPAKQQTPNIVYILSDDLGWMDLHVQGGARFETPNIDRLASQGMRFNYAYTMPNCAPTRSCMQTGKYSPRTGIYTVGNANRGSARDRKLTAPTNVTTLPLNIPTLPEMMRGSGYATALFGKWHLGTDDAHSPVARGYDQMAWYDGGGHFGFVTKPEIKHPKDQFLADFLADQGIRFMDKCRAENKPFLLLITHFAVHQPLQATPAVIKYFEDKYPGIDHKAAIYAAMIKQLDASVGRIMAEIDRLGIADNTFIVFTSDNGGYLGSTDNTPLRGGKGMHYEGGIRVPFIARWPGVIKPGAICDTPIHAIDFVPSMLDLIHWKAPAGTVLDGLSYVPLLKGQPDKAIQDRVLFWHCPVYLEAKGGGAGKNSKEIWRSTPGEVIRQGPWKLIETLETGKIELFNLIDDPSEKNDLSQKDPQRTDEMLAKQHEWRDNLHAAMPVPNPDYQKASASKADKKMKKHNKKNPADADNDDDE